MLKSVKEDPNLRAFLSYLFVEKGLSQNTVKAYQKDIESFLSWLQKYHINYINLTEADTNKYISFLFESKLKSSSVNRKISSLKAFYLFLLKKNKINISPVAEIISPKQEK